MKQNDVLFSKRFKGETEIIAYYLVENVIDDFRVECFRINYDNGEYEVNPILFEKQTKKVLILNEDIIDNLPKLKKAIDIFNRRRK